MSDSSLQVTLSGLLELAAREIAQTAVSNELIGHVTPYRDESVDEAVGEQVRTAEDAHRILGVPYALSSEVPDDGQLSISISLVDAKHLDTLGTEEVPISSTDIRIAQRGLHVCSNCHERSFKMATRPQL